MRDETISLETICSILNRPEWLKEYREKPFLTVRLFLFKKLESLRKPHADDNDPHWEGNFLQRAIDREVMIEEFEDYHIHPCQAHNHMPGQECPYFNGKTHCWTENCPNYKEGE